MKTAVDWLIEQILEFPLDDSTDDSTNAAHLKKHVNKITVFEKAKEMEKKQITDAYDISGMRSVLYDEQQGDGQDYYNYLINDFSE